MVLSKWRARVLMVVLAPLTFFGGRAQAQQLDRSAPVLDLPEGEYPATPIRVGQANLTLTADVGTEYDSNIYAAQNNKVDDVKLVVTPRANLVYDLESAKLEARAYLRLNQFLKNQDENSFEFGLRTASTFRVSSTDTIQLNGIYFRESEDRGDPEARKIQLIGPRTFQLGNGELAYLRKGGRISLEARALFDKVKYRSAIDSERDYTNYVGVGQVKYRLSGITNIYGEAFFQRRDFRLATDFSGVNRDAKTIGARAGIAFDPGGKIRGNIAIGAFRSNPDDARLRSRTGISADGKLVYSPVRRSAITLDVFSGDMATVTSGALGRTDTRIKLGFQQEIRRNIRGQIGVVYRHTAFVGTTEKLKLWAGQGEVEYLFNRRIALAATMRYSSRTSVSRTNDMERFRGGLELRLQY